MQMEAQGSRFQAECTKNGQAAKQLTSKPSQLNPANASKSAQPIHTVPGQQATQTWQIITNNCMVFPKGSEPL